MRKRASRRFRLETVLRVRKRQEDLRAMALAETQAGIGKAQRRREELTAMQRSALTEASARTRAAFDAADIRRFFQYERHLARNVVETDARLAELHGIADNRRVELEEASRKKRAIERLRDRHAQTVAEAYRYWEQRVSDEVASSRAHQARGKDRR